MAEACRKRRCNPHPAAYRTSPKRRKTNSADGVPVSSRPSRRIRELNSRWKRNGAAPADRPHPANSSPAASSCCWIAVTRGAACDRRGTRPSFHFLICWNATPCGWLKSANASDPPAATSSSPPHLSPATPISTPAISRIG